MVAARVFLGVFEAGFGPAIPLYFCEYLPWILVFRSPCKALFYTKKEMGLRVRFRNNFLDLVLNDDPQMAYWFGFAAVAGAFGGLLAFGISHTNTHIDDWRLLFIVEVCLDHSPLRMGWLKLQYAGYSNYRPSSGHLPSATRPS